MKISTLDHLNNNPTVCLSEFPNEVIVLIFDFLDAPALLTAAKVSWSWNKMIEACENALWSKQVEKKLGVKDLSLCGTSWKQAWLTCKPKQAKKIHTLLQNSSESVQPSLADLGLTVLPTKLFNFSHIRRLYLYENKLSTLPEQITQLTSLRLLSIFRNNFTTIPDAVTRMPQLEGLWMYDNQLTAIPATIARLTNLSFLHLSNNKIKEVPAELGSLKNLENLYLSSNQISELPEQIGNLANLQHLLIADNKLSELPVTMTSLTRLTRLDLSHNNIKEAPEQVKHVTTVVVRCDHHPLYHHNNPQLSALTAMPPVVSQR